MEFSEISRFKKLIFVFCIHTKKLKLLLIGPLRPRGMGGGAKGLTDMSAKNVRFFGWLPLVFDALLQEGQDVQGK